MLDTDENSGTSGWLYYFRYIPYLFLALLCYVMGYVLMAFKKDDIPKRMQASAVSARRQSLEGLLAVSYTHLCSFEYTIMKEWLKQPLFYYP